MSTTALHIIQLVQSLPDADQRAISEALTRSRADLGSRPRRRLERLADGSYFNPEGIPNDDPIFKTLEEIEAARSGRRIRACEKGACLQTDPD